MLSVLAAGFLGIDHFTPPWDVFFLPLFNLLIALYQLPGGEYHATDNICTHEYAQLSDGWLEDGCIECPLHAARFDVRTGKALCAPAEQDLDVFETRVEGDDLLLKMPG